MKTVMRINAFVIVGIMVCIFGHAVLAGGTALGLWSNMGLQLAEIAEILVYVHIALILLRTMQLFVPELRSYNALKTHFSQNGGFPKGFVKMFKEAKILAKMKKQNRHFWMTRISGVLFLVLILAHKTWIWVGPTEQGGFKVVLLLVQLVYILAIFVHVLINIRPLLGKFGQGANKGLQRALTAFFVVLMGFICTGMVYHFIG